MFEILMTGIVSKSSILLVEKGLKRDYNTALSLDFFCLYSEYEIPVGFVFTNFHIRKTGLFIKVNAKLVDVTQQWGLPMDFIPMGYKTISRIEFENAESIIAIKKGMPIINSWENSDYKFELIA